jgi:hypothetical protein
MRIDWKGKPFNVDTKFEQVKRGKNLLLITNRKCGCPSKLSHATFQEEADDQITYLPDAL